MSDCIRKWLRIVESEMENDETDPEEMIDAFYSAYDASGLNDKVTISLMLDPDSPDTTVELNHISTKEEFRGTGLATKVMSLLTDCADEYHVILRLGVASDADGRNGSMDAEQLVDWYQNWGFEGGHVMRRYPDEPR